MGCCITYVRKSHAVYQQLTPVERTETGRQRIAEPNDAEQLGAPSITVGNY
jgi:hypothetical protein